MLGNLDRLDETATLVTPNVRADLYLRVTFAIKGPMIVTARAGEGGSISPETAEVECGSDLALTMKPDHCFEIDDVKVTRGGGDPVSVIEDVKIDPKTLVGTYILDFITTNCTVEVSFKERGPFKVTVEIEGEGRASQITDSLSFGPIKAIWDLNLPKTEKQTFEVECGENFTIGMIPDTPKGHDLIDIKVAQGDNPPVSVFKDIKSFDDFWAVPKRGYVYDITDVQSDYKILVSFGEKLSLVSGDVSGDGELDSQDAMLILLASVGLIELTDEEKEIADLNGDGEVNSEDGLIALLKSVGLRAPREDAFEFYAGKANLKFAESHGISGERIKVPITLDQTMPIAAGDICISYDSSVLRAVSVSSDEDAILVYNVDESGMVRISFVRKDVLRSKKLLEIEFEVINERFSPLKFDNAEFCRPDFSTLDVKCTNGKFNLLQMPVDYTVLLQNFPNPFNPETWIPFKLSKPGIVNINIYSASGQLVHKLDLGHKDVGDYSSRDRAIYWDGRNDNGEQVSSGIYFYSIKSGDFTATKKMIISR